MIQNCLAKNYSSPKYPLFIALQNCLNSVNNKKSIRDAKSDISSFVDKIGSEGQKFVLTWLMESLDLPQFRQKPNSPHRLAYLSDTLKQYSNSNDFLFYFPDILLKICKQNNLPTVLQNMCQSLKLSSSTQVIIALSLYLSDRPDFIEQGELKLTAQLKQLLKSDKGCELNQKILEQLLFQISSSPELSLKLQEQYNYLLELADKNTEECNTKLYNYLKCDWQFFAKENYSVDKPTQIFSKKVDYFRQLGPFITSQLELIKNAITQIGQLSEDDVFQCIVMMTEDKSRYDSGIQRFAIEMLYSANKKNSRAEDLKKSLNADFASKKSSGVWNIQNFINAVNLTCPNTKWTNVFAQFDRSKLQIQSEQHFLNIMKAFQKSKKGQQKWKVPQNLYLKKWNNVHSQALFLFHLFSCKDIDALFLNEVPTKKVQKLANKQSIANLQKQIWAHVQLVQMLVQVSDYRFIPIRQLFQIPLAKCPQLILTTLSEIRPSKGQALLDELFSNLLPQYLHNHSTNIKLLEALWENNQDLVISCICQIYKSECKKQNSFNLSRVLDITQSIKDSLIPFTTWNDYEFSIPLAVIAGKREFLNFQPWIIDRIQKLSNSFVRAILLYIENYLLKNIRNIPHVSHKQNMLQKAQLTIDLLNKIFYTIMSKLKREQISYRNFELLKRIFKQCCQNFPEITQHQIPDQIQRETEREINRIYKQEITIKQAIERMKKLKSSPKQEDQSQFASHITFLYSEISYHHTYPEKQLMITAELFAALINANLIQNNIFTMFLNVLEDGLKEQNLRYSFSLRVLQKIKTKLTQQSWFCEKMIDNQIIMKKNPQIVQQLIKNLNPPKQLSAEKQRKIKQAIRLKNAPPPEPAISVIVPQQDEVPIQSSKKLQQNDYQILTVLDNSKKKQFEDKENKLGRINIIFNTLSTNNIQQKSKQLRTMIEKDPKIVILLSNSIVFKRISTTSQNNGMDVMYKLIQKLPVLQKPVLRITYKILQEWFALKNKSTNDKKLTNFKNIGAWLGKLTIGKGMPVPIHKLNIRKILIDSYSSHRLHMNVPVVIKILQFMHVHQQIFRITSPWLNRIIGTLSEIQDKLKDEQSASIKNQIKAFFKSVNMKMENFQVAQTSYLNLSNNRIIIPQLDKYIKIDEQLQKKYLPMKIDLKAIITRAVNDSIQQIVEPVIDRAVKIAKVTTKQLITKDFAYQPDPERFRESSYKLVKQMAGPLAQVTCRQPLKASMNRSLKNMLMQSINDPIQYENIIQKAITDNLDFGCTLIKQAVIQSAQEVIKKDQAINESIQMRYTAKNQGIPFKNENAQFEIPSIVPEQLRPRPGGLSSQQYQVYSQFKKEKSYPSPKRIEQVSITDKIIEIISQKGPIKTIKQLTQSDLSCKQQVLSKLHGYIGLYAQDQAQVEYYIDVCQAIKDNFDPKQCWKSFKQINDIKKKQIQKVVRKLARQKKYLPESALNELDKNSEEQNKVIALFETWLETAHQGIQPFLRNLEQMFNKSQNQIKVFFSCSLHYAMQKVVESFSQIHECYDTNYIQNYTKLIIISYKTIASNNCSLYLQHTIQSILDVFNKLQNGSSQFCYQRPFFKLFTNLICDVTRKQYDIDHQKVLTFYCVLAKQLQKIGPVSCPNFTCAWMELICNKNFMPALLMRHEYWDLYYHLLCCLLKFVRQYITQQNLTKKENNQPYQSFYLGVLKLIIVILHDFPDFLSEFSLQLAQLAGPKFYQLNNVIVSAFPKQMKFQSPLKIDKRQDFILQCKKGGMPKYYKLKFDKPTLNTYLQADHKDSSVKDKLARQQQENLQLLVLYLSIMSIENQITQIDAMKKLTEIIINCYEETRLKIINCVLNLIRYPNNVTQFLIDVTKDLIFNKQVKDNSVREMMLGCIIARMNAESPQSWGQIYLARQIQIFKNELFTLNVSPRILQLL